MMMGKVALLSPLVFVAAAYDKLHLIDLQRIICHGDIHFLDIPLDTAQLQANEYTPHVVTFLRSNARTRDLIWTLVNSNDTMWDRGLVLTSLADQYLSSRRLSEATEDFFEGEDQVEEEVKIPSQKALRRLEALGPRRRAPVQFDNSVALPNPRRRSTELPRRRNAPAPPTTPAAPVVIVDSPRDGYKSIGTGSTPYGFTSESELKALYAGILPTSTAQGPGLYGKSSYNPTMATGSVMIDTAHFEEANTYYNYYLYQRLRHAQCAGYDCCYGCASACFVKDGARETCSMTFDRQMYREDLMRDTGFFPGDEGAYPLKIRIYQINWNDQTDGGRAVDNPDICWNKFTGTCPAENCKEPDASNIVQDMFVTVTPVDLIIENPNLTGHAKGFAGTLFLGSAAVILRVLSEL